MVIMIIEVNPGPSRELIPLAASAPVTLAAAGSVQAYLESARSRNTIRGYRSHFRQFQSWCSVAGRCALPAAPETIACYLSERAGHLRPVTLACHLAAISKAHKTAGLASPVKDNALVFEVLKGLKRVHGTAVTQKAPVLTDDLRLMLRHLPEDLLGIRDRALLLIGFAGAFRRSELVGLNVEDLAFTPEGLQITLRRSKTDQEGTGRDVAIPFGAHASTCPVAALRAWLDAAALTEGPVFRQMRRHGRMSPARLSDHAVAVVVKGYAAAAGLDPKNYSGHSLRAGLVTSAARAGVPERIIMRQTGHRSVEMVLRYVRQANAFRENALNSLGL
jgi:integrase